MKIIRNIAPNSLNKYLIAIGLILTQFLIFYAIIFIFSKYVFWIFGSIIIIQIIFAIYMANHKSMPEFKMLWLSLVLIFPAFGLVVFLSVRLGFGNRKYKRKIKEFELKIESFKNFEEFADLGIKSYTTYFKNSGSYPTYQINEIAYHESGESAFVDILKELRKAEKYILIETFILAKGTMWNQILEILKEKAKNGVEIKLIYDGTNNVKLLPFSYKEELRELGIEVEVFSPLKPIIEAHHNNRDHRKMVIIDGITAFHGGYNIADEYINEEERFGYWKDTGIKIKGNAVSSMVLMFFEMWYLCNGENLDISKYLVNQKNANSKGYIIPFADNPVDAQTTSINCYLQMIYQAKQYVYIMTPYLILEHKLETALIEAVKRGVEVKILMPRIPDKKVIYYVGRTNYKELVNNHIQIYEFTPGFSHGKQILCDDEIAVIGSINLDYRSFYLNYENASLIYQHPVLKDIKRDFDTTFTKSFLITEENIKEFNLLKYLLGKILKIFSPLF